VAGLGLLILAGGLGAVRRAHREVRAGSRLRDRPSGLEFAYAPGGTFLMGCVADDSRCGPEEKPPHPVTVSPFWMGHTPVTVRAYQRCVDAGRCPDEPLHQTQKWCNGSSPRANHPLNCVTWIEAQAFCTWVGGELPSSEQYEFAARSGGDRLYPWGDAPLDATRANSCDARCTQALSAERRARFEEQNLIDSSLDDGFAATSPVEHFHAGDTPWGLSDLAGNVMQWTRTEMAPAHEDPGSPIRKEVRGGGYLGNATTLRTSDRRNGRDPDKRFEPVGFRCVLPPERR
jgi:formylglycine-generating enzyme required for sulfatase activity